MRNMLLVFFIGLGLWLRGGTVDKAFRALDIYDYFKARSLFYKALHKEPTASAYGLAIIYFRRDNPFHQPDSATRYIRAAIGSFEAEKIRKNKKFDEWKISGIGLQSLKSDIYQLAFTNALTAGTVKALEYFIQHYEDAREFDLAVHARDSMEFSLASHLDTWAAYKEFCERFPASTFRERAMALYEERMFSTWTASGTIKAYESFIEKFPGGPYAEEAENAIFGLSTVSGNIDDYYLFIRKYPANRNVEKAWYNIYTLYTKDFKPETFNDFLKVFPDYPYGENVNRDLELSKLILLPARQNGKWGFIDTTGKEVIPFIYEWCEEFEEGLAAVGFNGKAGFIDKSGILVFPAEFDEVENFREGFAEVTIGGKSGLIRRTGKKILPCEFEEIAIEYPERLIGLKKGGKYGFYDLKGDLVIPFYFDKVGSFRYGLATAELNGKWGFIDVKGNWVIRPEYDQAYDFNNEGHARVARGKRMGVINRAGGILIPFSYTFIYPQSEGTFLVEDSLHYGFIDSTGAVMIPLTFEKQVLHTTFTGFHHGVAPGYRAGKAGLIDKKGKFVIPFDYESIEPLSGEEGLYIARKKGKYGLIDKKGKTVIPFSYERFSMLVQGSAEVCKEADGMCGVINKQKKVIVPLIYDDARRNVTASVFIVELEGKFGLIDLSGLVLLEPVYDELEAGPEFVVTEKDKKLAWFDLKTRAFFWTEK